MSEDNLLGKINSFPTPSEIVAQLDKYIIGQTDAKKNVAIALRNRWRRLNAAPDFRQEILPNNILMIGATGVGKTEIARRLAKIADAPFTKVEASKFTEVGYVGRDVESMVRDLVEQAVSLVKTKRKAAVKLKAAAAVEDIILDALIPPIGRPGDDDETAMSSQSAEDRDLNERTRERFREKILSGELDERKIEISVSASGGAAGGLIGNGPMDEVGMMNLQEMLNGIGPKKSKKRKMTIKDAKKVLLDEEAQKLIDMDEVKDEAIRLVENTGIIFIDEIDKIVSGGGKGSGGPDVSREGVQRDLLPVVEGTAVNTKYGVVNTDHILFIAAGAFHYSKPSDLIPELQGRFPIRVELQSLTKHDFLRILTEPDNALTKQYIELLKAEEITLNFHTEAIAKIAEYAHKLNEEVENIGARRLHTVMSTLLNEVLFLVPDKILPKSVIEVTAEMVDEKFKDLVKDKNLSHYIL